MGKSKDLATGNSAFYQDQTESDTRYVNTSGDTMTGNLLLGSNSVGIGTSSPLTPLMIESTGGNVSSGNAIKSSTMKGISLNAQEGAAHTNKTGVWIASNGSHWSGMAGGRSNTSTWGTDLGFYTHEDATSDLTYSRLRMHIDSAGRVTKPSQPSFQAYGASSWQTVSSGNTAVIQLNVAHSNVGSNYNTSNYRFTAPVAGKYLFSINCYCRLETHDDDSNHAYVFLQKNGATYINAIAIYGYYNSGDVDQTQNVCCLMTMAAGDYATAALNAASGDASAYRGATTFSGFLVG